VVGVPFRTCPVCTPASRASTAVVTVRRAVLTVGLYLRGSLLRFVSNVVIPEGLG